MDGCIKAACSITGAGVGAALSVVPGTSFVIVPVKAMAIIGACLGGTMTAVPFYLPECMIPHGNFKKACLATVAVASSYFFGTLLGVEACQLAGFEVAPSAALKVSGGAVLTAAAIETYLVTVGFISYKAYQLLSACKRQNIGADLALAQAPFPPIGIIIEAGEENRAPQGYVAMPND